MRRKYESGREPPQLRYAWIVALACIAVTGLTPTAALAEEPEAAEEVAVEEAAVEEVVVEEAVAEEAVAEEMTEAEAAEAEESLAEAQESIDLAQARLDEARRQFEKRFPYDTEPDPTAEPVGPGFLSKRYHDPRQTGCLVR